MHYIILYIHTDQPAYSEVLGVYSDKNKAIDKMIEFAHYREDSSGMLTQYFKQTDEYRSLSDLRSLVCETMTIRDVDIYHIVELDES